MSQTSTPIHWRTASGVSEGFKTLFEKMQACRNAKAVADNRHKTKMLTAQYVELERRAKKKFLDSYQNGRSFLHRVHGQIPGGCSVGKLNRGSRIFSGTKAVQTLTRTMRLGFFRGKLSYLRVEDFIEWLQNPENTRYEEWENAGVAFNVYDEKRVRTYRKLPALSKM